MKILVTIIFFLATLMAVTIYHFPPEQNLYYPPCFFKKCTGLDCPGCGSTRAIYQLVHGNVGQAADHNIMLLIFMPVMLVGLLNVFGGRWRRAWQHLNKPVLVLWLVIFFWVLRNLPLIPFTWMHSDK